MKIITTALAVGIGSFAFASPAVAEGSKTTVTTTSANGFHTTVQTKEAPAFTPSFAASRAGVSIDLWPSEKNLAATAGAELSLQIARKLFLDLAYSGAFAHVGDAIDKGDNIGWGNPSIGLHVADSPSRQFSYHFGVGFTAPVLQDPSKEVSNAAFYALRIRGYMDADRFVRGHMAASASLGMEWNPFGPIYLRGMLRPVVYIPTSDKYTAFPTIRAGLPEQSPGDTVVTVEHAVDLELRSKIGLGGGIRAQGVYTPMRDDLIQTALEPFVQIVPRRSGLYARVGMPVAIDPDLGPGFSGDKLAAVRVQIGGQW
ncbi:MAG: hypothetical protein R3B70_37790 [Polyangiaceae bacterium]